MAQPYQALIKGCIQNKPAAQRELYERFAPGMLAVCYRYVRDQADAEDILQDGFVKIFNKIGKFDQKGSLEGWVRRVMINTAIDHLRRKKYQNHQTEINDEITEEVAANALDDLETEFLFELIQKLPAGYRLVFNLYAIEGYSHREIGEKLGITESTSRSQYTRGRATLKKQIEQIYMDKNIYKDVI